MCSIIGYKGKFDPDLVQKLFFNSRIRGLHAFGYSCLYQGQIQVKKFLKYEDFIKSITEDKPDNFIAHFRYSTSGDHKNEQNNQPLFKESISMVFNGVIDMASKEELEKKYNTHLDTENDGELALIHKDQSNEDLLQLIRHKTFAGLFLNKEGQIEVLRNRQRPCYKGSKEGNQIIASTKDILTRSGVTEEVEEIKPMELYEL